MKKILISILAIAAIVSCNKENTQDNSSIENTSRFPLIKVDNLETKTVLDGTQVKFKVGDCISIFNGIVSDTDHHGHCKYECINIENGVASFKWMDGMNGDVPINEYEPADDVDIIATYPNRSKETSAFEPEVAGYGEGTVMIRMVATGAASDQNTFAGTSLPIIAYAPQGQMLKFKHTCGLLKVTLKGTAAISNVVMTGDTYITGDASVAYAAEEPVLTVVGSNTKAKTIKYSYNAPVQLTTEGRDFYFGLPVGTHNVTFTFTDTDGSNMTKTAQGLEIKRATITPPKNPLTYVPDINTVTDLSANDSYANCYVVQTAGSYSFDAKKPNGQAVTGTSATWIWAAGEKIKDDGEQVGSVCAITEMINNVSLKDGKLCFDIPENFVVGNVVVGVVGDDNNLAWTWHVWLTRNLEDVTAAGVTVMDRNLGAAYKFDVKTVDNAAQLLLGKGNQYQWGRKDPILGPRNNTEEATAFGSSQKCIINTAAGINNVTSWGTGGDFGGLTPEDGIRYPLTMAAAGNVPGEDDTTTAWSSRVNCNPCPYGYKVMSQSDFAALVAAGDMVSETYSSDTNYAQMKLAGSVVFPRLGRRPASSGKTGKSCGTNCVGIYWYDDVKATGYRFYWSTNTTVNTTNTKEYTEWADAGSCNAVSVRCVKVND